jgi:diadenosine tetraphosphatase ApaH/serine/threonine PP2A family protein phosphatase
MEKIFALIDYHAFQGHTHVPGIFTEDLRFFSPEEIGYEYTLGDQKTMTNVGSVGQPRDGDPRACYVVIDDGGTASGEAPSTGPASSTLNFPAALRPVVRFRRVEYPFEETIAKIYAIPELDNFLGDRLRDGR